jgi:iron complex transport system substrate-binding protein
MKGIRVITASFTKHTKITKNTKNLLFVVVIFVGFVNFVSWPSAGAAQTTATKTPARIISLIPAVTEMLYAIGADRQVVAVSSFDQYPPQVTQLPRVGALIDPDVERILSLRPDLVVVYESQVDLRRQLERASIPMYVYKHAGLADVTSTMRSLGERVGHGLDASRAASQIDSRLMAIRTLVASRSHPKTMLVFGRDALALRGVYASGGVGFLNDMLTVAGGDNVFADVKQQSVQATSELILARRPQAIVELRAERIAARQKRQEIDVWQSLSSVPAVRDKRVTLIDDDRTVIPGPRVAEGTELIARALHPEVFAK